MKIFGFVKKLFFVGLTILSSFTNANSLNAIPLSCISMSNQELKQDYKLLMLMEMNLCFFDLVLKQVNGVAVVIISIIRMQNLCSWCSKKSKC